MKRLILIICTLLLASSLEAATYWVDGTNGSNANGCNNSATPLTTTAKQTINAGIACLVSSDTLNIRSGTYDAGIPGFDVPGGTAAAKTTIQGWAAENPIIRPTVDYTTVLAVFVF